MASDFVLSTGDLLVIVPQFGVATVTVPPAPLIGKGSPMGILTVPVCVEGDEFPEILRMPLAYLTPSHSQPGMGLLSIELDDSHWTRTMKCGGKKMLRVGGTVQAKLQVTVPAMIPSYPAPTPDSTTEYKSTGNYVTTKNIFFKAE